MILNFWLELCLTIGSSAGIMLQALTNLYIYGTKSMRFHLLNLLISYFGFSALPLNISCFLDPLSIPDVLLSPPESSSSHSLRLHHQFLIFPLARNKIRRLKSTLPMDDLLSELHWEDMSEFGLPPGFRFHPTDEELITFYLASKVFHGVLLGLEIVEIDLNRCEPWELPDAAKMGEKEWYFFSLRDRKYPTGLRTNRATGAGYWKATGKDRQVNSATTGALIGMKKTLVFYKGRAPRGEKTKWVMHEYRLDGHLSCRHQEEWVICRIFNKISGEKKNGVLEQRRGGNNNKNMLAESYSRSSVTANSIPAPLEPCPCPTTPRSVYECHHQSQLPPPAGGFRRNAPPTDQPQEIINMLTPSAFKTHIIGFQSPTNTSAAATLTPSTHVSSLFSHQYFGSKDQPAASFPKQCTSTEGTFPHLEIADGNFNWVDSHQAITCQNPLIFETDCCNFLGSAGTNACQASSSTPIAFNRAGFQTMLDASHISLSGESFPSLDS